MLDRKNVWEERLATAVPYVLGTTSLTLFLAIIGFFLLSSIPGDLADESSLVDALSSLHQRLPWIIISILAIAHLIWSLRFGFKVRTTTPRARVRGWMVHLALGVPLLLTLLFQFGIISLILAVPEVIASILSGIGLGISVRSLHESLPSEGEGGIGKEDYSR